MATRFFVVDRGDNVLASGPNEADLTTEYSRMVRRGEVYVVEVDVREMGREDLANELAAAGLPTEDWETLDIDEMRRQVAELWDNNQLSAG